MLGFDCYGLWGVGCSVLREWEMCTRPCACGSNSLMNPNEDEVDS